MSSNLLQKIYNYSPYILQTLGLNFYSFKVHRERYGKEFKKICSFLSESQYYTPSQIKDYQSKQLRTIINHAYNTTVYYKSLFDRINLKPTDIDSSEDLHKIPILTKEDIKNNFNDLVSSKYNRKDLVQGHTSGTTGTPLDILWDKHTCEFTNALDWRQKNWAGVQYGQKIAIILGRTVVPINKTKPPFWQTDYIHNQLWLSAFHLTDSYLDSYFKKLKSFSPVAIEGYPSTVYILAKYLNERNLTFPLKSILTSSETLYPLQREAIEQAFECKVFDFYGMAERVLFATECASHTNPHLNFEYGLTEIVDDNGTPLDAGQTGIIVSTSLQNMGMPLIRYKTSDVSTIKEEKCTCGREMPLLEKISTKAEDIIICPDGRLISPSVLTHPFKPMHNIDKSQIIQNDINNITINIVKKPAFTKKDELTLLKSFQERVGSDIEITIKYVDTIQRTSSGKFRWVISKVAKNIYDFNKLE